ncbi:hypothetical protein Plhal304r1_c039g0116691 [Plasmopara halstedii]
MIAERSISRRLCFLLLSCVAVSIYSEIAQLEAMMMSNEQTIAQRHDRALLSTPDQMSTSLEERVAPVAVEEEAGMLSRFVSYFKPSNLWKKLASSWIMRFFKPHIYLRYSSDRLAAGNKLFIKVHADKAKDLFSSDEFRKWSKYFTAAFPDNPWFGDKLAFGDLFGAALIEYGVKAQDNAKSEAFVDDLKKSLRALSDRLQKDESSKLIGVQLQEQIDRAFGNEVKLVNADNVQPVHKLSLLQEMTAEAKLVNADNVQSVHKLSSPQGMISEEKLVNADDVQPVLKLSSQQEMTDEEKLVNADNVQPVHKLSSQQKVISKPVNSVTSTLNEQEKIASNLLAASGLDKVETYTFNSVNFVRWSKTMAIHFNSEEYDGAGIMLTTLAKLDKKKLLASISTTKVVDGKLAFGDNFRAAMMDYIAIAKDTDDLKGFAEELEKSLLALINQLHGDKSADILKGELLVSSMNKNNKNLVDLFKESSVQTWYLDKSQKDKEEAFSVLDRRLKMQGITSKQIGEAFSHDPDILTSKQIGEAVSQDPDILTGNAMDDLVHYKLSILLKNYKSERVTSDESFLDTWFQEAFILNAVPKRALAILRGSFKDPQILRSCVHSISYGGALETFSRKIKSAVTNGWKGQKDAKVLGSFELEKFSFKDPVVNVWISYMTNCYEKVVGDKIAEIIFEPFRKDVPELIKAGKGNSYPPYRFISESLQEMMPKQAENSS